MDEKLLTQALREIAEQEIPDTMNLYPQIAAQAEKTMLRAARARGAWALVAAMMMLLTAAAAFAVVRWQVSDPGLEGAQAADLITPLDLTQRMDGVTVTLDYGYLDANRVSVGYTVSGELEPGTLYSVKDAALRDSVGRAFPTLFGMSAALPYQLSDNNAVEPFTMSGTATYDGCLIDRSAENVPLQFSLALERVTFAQDPQSVATAVIEPISQIAIDATATIASIQPTLIAYDAADGPCGSYGSGSGGGSGFIERIEPIGPFQFDFALPYIPAQIIYEPLTDTTNDTQITLEQVSITPSFARSTFCVEATESMRFDSVDMGIQVGDQQIDLASTPQSAGPFIGFSNQIVTLLPAAADRPSDCFDILINQSLYDLEGEWALTIEALGARMGGISTQFGDDLTVYEYYPSTEFLPTVQARLATLLPDAPLEPVEATEMQQAGVRVAIPADQASLLQSDLDDVIVQELQGPWVFRFTPS